MTARFLPRNNYFGSGTTRKRPDFTEFVDEFHVIGKATTEPECRAVIKEVVDLTLSLLEVPNGYRAFLVPGSDTGAVEMFIWTVLGERLVDVFHNEAFSSQWAEDCKELGIKMNSYKADYGKLPDFSRFDKKNDCIVTWNGTTSGVRVPDGDWIPDDREGIVICDATSAVFAVKMPWSKLDVVTFSWQKALGGEAAHGTVILSPRALARISTAKVSRPIPSLFRITPEMLQDSTNVNNALSMMCVSDALHALRWVKSLGGLSGGIARTESNFAAVESFVKANSTWIDFLATTPKTRSATSVCLTMKLPPKTIAAILGAVEKEKVGYDLGAYRTAPPGMRVWCGMTVEAADVACLMQWIGYFYQTLHLGQKDVRAPTSRPSSPNFSSGPCKKFPTATQYYDPNGVLGRSHRHALCKGRTVKAADDLLGLAGCPKGYVAAIVTGGCKAAMEAALWSFLGSKPVDIFTADDMSRQYARTIQSELKVPLVNVYDAGAEGRIPDYSMANALNDCVFVWNGSTNGVRCPSGDWVSDDREGLVICDVSSAIFAMPLPWSKLDVVTFSWQKALGGEAAHGTIILSPRALARLNADRVPRPAPKLYRLKKNVAMFKGDVINTISLMCIEDVIQSCAWANRNGGLRFLQTRTMANYGGVAKFVQRNSAKIAFVADDPNLRSVTSCVLRVKMPAQSVTDIVASLREKGAATGLTVSGQPTYLRIWCGPTVEALDVELFLNQLQLLLNASKPSAKL